MDRALQAKLEAIPGLVASDTALLRRGRFTQVDLLLEVGETPACLGVREGHIAACQIGRAVMRSWTFAIRGSEDAWRRFWLPFPPPGFHDVFALAKSGAFRIEGDMRPLMTHLLYFKGVLAAPRQLKSE